jgi:ComF family protein
MAAVFVYGGPILDAVHRLKYEGRTELARPLGRRLASAARPHGGRFDLVVPVALHPRRLRARGFNQSALLAAPVARAVGAAFAPRCLRRLRETTPQVELGSTEREGNVRGAFAARGVMEKSILLVDDVRTTGSTLRAAADALRRAGASRVASLVLAVAE